MNPTTLLKQVEVNIGGGIRISVYKQIVGPDGFLHEHPHRISIGPFDDFDQVIAENNANLQRMGYPAINPDELTFVTAQRTASHAHPITQEIMRIEAAKIAEERGREEESSLRKNAEDEAMRAAEKRAFEDAVAAAVAKAKI